MFKISVITSVKNGAKTVERCIKSVQSQSGVEVEHIIVDGGSDDNTFEIIQDYAPSIIYINYPNSTMYEAMNLGVENCSSEYICFLNCDDYYYSTSSLCNLVLSFTKSPDIGLVYGNCIFVSDSHKVLYSLYPYSKFRYLTARLRLFNVSHPTWIIKKSIFKSFKGYDISFKYVSDTDFFLRLIKHNIILQYVNIHVANFEISGNNASKSNEAKKEWRRLFEIYNGNSKLSYFFHYLLLILFYLKDFKYFIHKIKKHV